ncbi:hypothetical protein Zmor_018707 [Zophobas morio]|uniref:Uncharacterized protein n=1 Tax=Zophobas morio TaxID=2755281 RepID=A0AA38ICW7_9CUCU|nr:hypothetical protein Zmor_018707 [Zophobas morio]
MTSWVQNDKENRKYRVKLEEQLARTMGGNGSAIETRWQSIKEAIKEAERQIPQERLVKKATWFDEECRNEMQKRVQLRLLTLGNAFSMR